MAAKFVEIGKELMGRKESLVTAKLIFMQAFAIHPTDECAHLLSKCEENN